MKYFLLVFGIYLYANSQQVDCLSYRRPPIPVVGRSNHNIVPIYQQANRNLNDNDDREESSPESSIQPPFWQLLGYKDAALTKLQIGHVNYEQITDSQFKEAMQQQKGANMKDDGEEDRKDVTESDFAEFKVPILSIKFFPYYGVNNLGRHMELMRPIIQQQTSIKLFSSDFRGSLVRSLFFNIFRNYLVSLQTLHIKIDSKYYQHSLNVLKTFPEMHINLAYFHIPTCVLFEPIFSNTKKLEQESLAELIAMEEDLLPNIDSIIINAAPCVDDEHSITLANMKWIRILIEKMNVKKLTFRFSDLEMHTSDASMSLGQMIKKELGVVWNLNIEQSFRDHQSIEFVKNIEGHMRIENYVWIKAAKGWIAHELKRNNSWNT